METQLGMPLLPFLGNYQSYVAKLHTQYNLSGILGANLQTLAVLSHTFPSVTEGVHHTVGFINSKSTMMKGMGVRGGGEPSTTTSSRVQSLHLPQVPHEDCMAPNSPSKASFYKSEIKRITCEHPLPLRPGTLLKLSCPHTCQKGKEQQAHSLG